MRKVKTFRRATYAQKLPINARNSGITLIALVVTIIVLLILAGVGISMLTGENSIINRAIQAKEATSQAEAREKVELEVLASLDKKGQIVREKLKENLNNNLGVQDNQIVDPNESNEFEDPFDFPLGEYDIRVNPNGKVEIMPKGEIPTPPTLVEEDIIFNPVPSTLTNKEVKVTIKAKVSTMRLTLQYALENPDDENNWQTYTGPVTMNDNGPIYARLINEKGEKSNHTTGNIENIDRKEPTIEEFKAVEGSETTNSVKVTVSASDDRQLASKGTYKFFAKEVAPVAASLEEDAQANGYKLNGTSTEGEYTYTNLEQGKSYTLKVIITDEAGNTIEQEIENQVEMQKVPDLVASADSEESPSTSPDYKEPNIKITYSETKWHNKESVHVTIETLEGLNTDGFTLQYSLNGEKWIDYVDGAGFDITENGAIHAKLVDSTNQSGLSASSTYTSFDRKKPTITIETEEPTVNSVKVNVTESKDYPTTAEAKDASGLAEENRYTYYIEEVGGSLGEKAELATNDTNYTYTGLEQGKEYKIKVRVKDNAGNIEDATTSITTMKIPDLNEEKEKGNVSFIHEPPGWTQEDVRAKIQTQNLPEEYKLQYRVTEEGEWEDYTDDIKSTGILVQQNNTKIQARLVDNTEPFPQEGGYVEDIVDKIDRIKPEATVETGKITSNSIELKISNVTDGLSGLKEEEPIRFYLIEGIVTEPEQIESQKGSPLETTTSAEYTYKYNNLSKDTSYTLVVQVEDKAGNILTEYKNEKTTKIPNAEEKITYNVSPTGDVWAQEKTVTFETEESDYDIIYSTDNVEWNEYTQGVKLTKNGAVYAKLREKTGNKQESEETLTVNVTQIDDKNPEITIDDGYPKITGTTIEVSVTASDLQQDGTEGSGIKSYAYYINDEEQPRETHETNNTKDTCILKNIDQIDNKTIKVIVTDNSDRTSEISVEVKNDEIPGDITDGGKLDGTPENPYEINSIEDLISIEAKRDSTNYAGKTIILKRDLNFNEVDSYADAENSEMFPDYNGDGSQQGIKEEVTDRNQVGYKPIGKFAGTFDGQGNTISNIYMSRDRGHSTDYYGFITDAKEGSNVKNLNIEGELNYKDSNEYILNYIRIGGLLGRNDGGTVENCESNIEVNIELPKCGLIFNSEDVGHNREIFVGGITGNNEGIVNKCKNYGTINVNVTRDYRNNLAEIDEGTNSIGGLVSNNQGKVLNSINYGKIEYISDSINNNMEYNVTDFVGGIVARNVKTGGAFDMTIENCINKADISANTVERTFIAGINGYSLGTGKTTINNVYNYGKILCTTHNTGKDLYIAGIVGDPETINIENCFNIGQIAHIPDTLESTTRYIGAISGYVHRDTNLINTKYLKGSAPYGTYHSSTVDPDNDKTGHTIECIPDLSEEQVLAEMNSIVQTHNSSSEDKWVEWNL